MPVAESSEDLLRRRRHTLGRHSPLFYDTPLELVSARGVWAKAADGTRYLDAYNNVPHVGHAHPAVANAVSKQMRKLALHTRYLNSRVVEYAEALLATFAPALDRVAFSNSGSEANELAIRVARLHTGSTGLLVSDHSYHGTTLALAQVTTALTVSEPLGDHVRALRIPDATGLDATAEARLLEESLGAVDEAIASLEEAGHGVAAVLIDSLFSTEGLVHTPAGYVDGLVDRVRSAGGLYISDEVQSGFGRTGVATWGYELFARVPDLVTMGKPMGNGHPLAATVLRADLLEEFGTANMYFNTFGGNPVSAAAGHAVLDVMAEEKLQERAAEVGTHIRGRLTEELAGNPRVESIRGTGLFVGVSFIDPEAGTSSGPTAKRVVEDMKSRRVLISRVGREDQVLKIRPPLAFERHHADILLDKLLASIDSL